MEDPYQRRLVRRAAAWDGVAYEPVDSWTLLTRWVAPLAAIPAVCGVLGPLLFSFDIANVRLRPNLPGLLLGGGTSYALTLVSVWLVGLWTDLLAPAFGAARGQGLKLAAYSGTASWVAGLLALYPPVGLPAAILAAAWSLRTLYLGLGPLTDAPEDRRLIYFAAILAGVLALGLAYALLVARATELGGPLSFG
jgi:hypothetical protein